MTILYHIISLKFKTINKLTIIILNRVKIDAYSLVISCRIIIDSLFTSHIYLFNKIIKNKIMKW